MDKKMNDDKEFSYMLLDRLVADCKYFLGNGNCCKKYLWAGNIKEQSKKMFELYNGFSQEEKPEWINKNKILEYTLKMHIKSFLKNNKLVENIVDFNYRIKWTVWQLVHKIINKPCKNYKRVLTFKEILKG